MGLNIALVAILASLPLGTVPQAGAHHEVGFYLAAIRSVEWQETVCMEDAEAANLSFQTVHDGIIAALVFENPNSDWHGLNYDHIFFEDVWWTGCNGLNYSTTPRISDVEIKYYVKDYISPYDPICGDGTRGYSCARQVNALWSGPPGTGRMEYQYYDVWIKSELIAAGGDTRRHVVNHETGHVFGLADGGPRSPFPNSGCPHSIMHPQYAGSSYYGCDGTTHSNGIYYPYVPPLPFPDLYTDVPKVWAITNGN